MNIGDIGPLDSLRSKIAERLRNRGSEDAAGDSGDGTSRVQDSDQVDLSDAGRALADRVQSEDEVLTPERTEELRQRVADGVYDEPEVMEETARRILESGDLETE